MGGERFVIGRDILGPNRTGRNGRHSRLSRYDLVLLIIPMAFFASILASHLSPISLQGGIAVGSMVGAIAVADALFLNPPRSTEK